MKTIDDELGEITNLLNERSKLFNADGWIPQRLFDENSDALRHRVPRLLEIIDSLRKENERCVTLNHELDDLLGESFQYLWAMERMYADGLAGDTSDPTLWENHQKIKALVNKLKDK